MILRRPLFWIILLAGVVLGACTRAPGAQPTSTPYAESTPVPTPTPVPSPMQGAPTASTPTVTQSHSSEVNLTPTPRPLGSCG
ncbi:MAG: hypothetical protein ACK4K2_06845 [Dehalococcoidia bacterium]